ncbi:MAG: hypothetical protein VW553_01690 [Alphaproteobacteria bacterium]
MDQAEQMARLRLIRTSNIGPMTYGLLLWFGHGCSGRHSGYG